MQVTITSKKLYYRGSEAYAYSSDSDAGHGIPYRCLD